MEPRTGSKTEWIFHLGLGGRNFYLFPVLTALLLALSSVNVCADANCAKLLDVDENGSAGSSRSLDNSGSSANELAANLAELYLYLNTAPTAHTIDPQQLTANKSIWEERLAKAQKLYPNIADLVRQQIVVLQGRSQTELDTELGNTHSTSQLQNSEFNRLVGERKAYVCDRTEQVRAELERLIGKSCADITKEELSNITELHLRNLNITELKSSDFSGLYNLLTLDLNYNNLTRLPVDLFLETSNLNRLYLSLNPFSSLPPEIFSHLKELKVLNLSHTGLVIIPPKLFSGNPHLLEVILDGNHIIHLPEDFYFSLLKVQKLKLNRNPLSPYAKSRVKLHFAHLGYELEL